MLDHGLRGPLTIITAPAGLGKTTLLSTGPATCTVPVAWLQLDKDDNLTGRFLSYLLAVLQAVDETIGIESTQHILFGKYGWLRCALKYSQ